MTGPDTNMNNGHRARRSRETSTANGVPSPAVLDPSGARARRGDVANAHASRGPRHRVAKPTTQMTTIAAQNLVMLATAA